MEGDDDGCGDPSTENYGPGQSSSAWCSAFENLTFANFSYFKLYQHLDECDVQFWHSGDRSADCPISQSWPCHTFHACSVLILVVLAARARRVLVRSQTPSNVPISNSRVDWNVLPTDIQKRVLASLPYERVYQLKVTSKPFRDCIEEELFLSLQTQYSCENLTFTAPHFYIRGGVLQFAGYDSSLRQWRRLPPLDYLPDYCAPDPDLFKEYLVCSHHGILCMNVSKSTKEKLIVFNPLTKQWKLLPPLRHRRNPVLLHILVDTDSQSFLVIAAGSSKSGDESLSRITELFDSRTWTWSRTGDLPGPDYALNEYQSGVLKEGNLFCVAFLDQDFGKGILRYNLNLGIWLTNWTYPLPFAQASTIVQLVENRGEIYVFSEQDSNEGGGGVRHCVDRLEWLCSDHGSELGVQLSSELGDESWNLRNVVRSKKLGGKSLEIYPEFVCVGYSEHELCVFNAIDHSGVLYDVRRFGKQRALEAPTGKGFDGEGFYSMNPLSFAIHPSFKMKI